MAEVKKNVIVGKVVSNKMKDAVTFLYETKILDSKYKKFVVRSKKFKARDKGNTCSIGDIARFQATRPLSKTIRWKVTEIIEKAK